MNEANRIVHEDLLLRKAWHKIDFCRNDFLSIEYMVGMETIDSMKTVIITRCVGDVMSHHWLSKVFAALVPPGDLSHYSSGILLAIVGSSTNVVYHRVVPGKVHLRSLSKRNT